MGGDTVAEGERRLGSGLKDSAQGDERRDVRERRGKDFLVGGGKPGAGPDEEFGDMGNGGCEWAQDGLGEAGGLHAGRFFPGVAGNGFASEREVEGGKGGELRFEGAGFVGGGRLFKEGGEFRNLVAGGGSFPERIGEKILFVGDRRGREFAQAELLAVGEQVAPNGGEIPSALKGNPRCCEDEQCDDGENAKGEGFEEGLHNFRRSRRNSGWGSMAGWSIQSSIRRCCSHMAASISAGLVSADERDAGEVTA